MEGVKHRYVERRSTGISGDVFVAVIRVEVNGAGNKEDTKLIPEVAG